MKTVLFHLLQIGLVIDQAFNVLFGGYADETLSSRAYRSWRGNKILGKICKPTIDTIFFWEANHCRSAYLAEVNKRQLPPEFFKWIEE